MACLFLLPKRAQYKMKTGYWEVIVESILREKGDWPGELLQSTGKKVPLKEQIWSLMLDVKRWQEQKKNVS